MDKSGSNESNRINLSKTTFNKRKYHDFLFHGLKLAYYEKYAQIIIEVCFLVTFQMLVFKCLLPISFLFSFL